MTNSSRLKIDRFFLFTVFGLALFGFVIFLSAALGLLARDGIDFTTVAIKQGISLGIGVGAFWFFSRFDHQRIRTTAFFILIGSIALNLLLFIPAITLKHGGAVRWIDLGFISFQPSEFLKIGVIIYMAAWIHFVKDKIKQAKFGMFPYLVVIGILGTLLITQKDNDTLAIISFTALAMMFIAGLPKRHLAIIVLIMGIGLTGALLKQEHARARIITYLTGGDEQSSAYQINQSLIAIGSGQLAGRGFGQSVQKFGYIPEPIGDSIFAVAAEEFGFIGSMVLIVLYLLLAVSSFRIGTKSRDMFGAMVAFGFAILVVIESFMNIAAMIGLIPLSGLPLLFVSHGGTALIIVMAAAGIVANVSKATRHPTAVR